MPQLRQKCGILRHRKADTRKDLERLFGVIQARCRILLRESEMWSVENVVCVTEVCVIISIVLVRMSQSGAFYRGADGGGCAGQLGDARFLKRRTHAWISGETKWHHEMLENPLRAALHLLHRKLIVLRQFWTS